MYGQAHKSRYSVLVYQVSEHITGFIMSNAFFTTDDNSWFKPTEHTRGPWDINACHAGPPTGLLARAVEQLVPEKRLIRLSVDLLRPIPFAGFSINTTMVRNGRSTASSTAQLLDGQGKLIVTANALHMIEQEPVNYPTHSKNCGNPIDATAGDFPIRTLHDLPAFNGTGVQVRYPHGENSTPGETAVWMKTVPLLETEVASGFQRICPLADCGNAFGRNAEPNDVSFINPDLTIVLHRDPIGEWLGSSSVGYWQPNGNALADALLFDEQGVVGRAMQTVLLRKN